MFQLGPDLYLLYKRAEEGLDGMRTIRVDENLIADSQAF